MKHQVEEVIATNRKYGEKYDEACKAYFRYKETLAPVLKYAIQELKDLTNEDIFKYLQSVFTSDIKTIRKYVDMDKNPEIEKEVERMDGLGQSIFDRGVSQGISQGIDIGRNQMVCILVRDGMLEPEKAAKKLGITMEELEKLIMDIEL